MTNLDQQIAIAIVCGWTWKQGDHADFLWHDPQNKSHSSFCKERSPLGCIADLPDYLNDLNAMHEAVMSLDFEQRSAFRKELQYLVAPQTRPVTGMATKQMGYECYNNWFHATAAQRAEAFLKTLNLWKD